MCRVEPGAWIPHRRGERGYAGRARSIDGPPGNTVQGGDGAAVPVRTRIGVGGHHGADQGADPGDAAASADAATEGDIQSQPVREDRLLDCLTDLHMLMVIGPFARRKLSGAFLLASRLNAAVDCRTLWKNVTNGYRFG